MLSHLLFKGFHVVRFFKYVEANDAENENLAGKNRSVCIGPEHRNMHINDLI